MTFLVSGEKTVLALQPKPTGTFAKSLPPQRSKNKTGTSNIINTEVNHVQMRNSEDEDVIEKTTIFSIKMKTEKNEKSRDLKRKPKRESELISSKRSSQVIVYEDKTIHKPYLSDSGATKFVMNIEKVNTQKGVKHVIKPHCQTEKIHT